MKGLGALLLLSARDGVCGLDAIGLGTNDSGGTQDVLES